MPDVINLPCPVISVIIPLYNNERYIGKCLTSLLNQTFKNFEVIVVDDCSTDNGVAVVESYVEKFDRRLIFSRMEKNTGSGALPRNKGLILSRGEYIFFMDADDMITNTALEEAYTLAKKYNAEVLYYPRYYNLSEDGLTYEVKACPKYTPGDKVTLNENLIGRINDMLDYKYRYQTWRTFSKRNFLIDNELFFPYVKISEDAIINYALFVYAKKFLYCPNPIYFYRDNKNSVLSSKKTPAQNINFWLSPVLFGLKTLDNFLKKNDFMEQHPQYRYALLRDFTLRRFRFLYKSSLELEPNVICEVIRKEYGERLGEYDVLIPVLCSCINSVRRHYKDKMDKANAQIAKLEKEIKTLRLKISKGV